MATPDSALPEASGGFSLSYAAAAALVVETLLVAGLVVGFSDTKKTSPPKDQVVMLTFPVIPEAPVPKPADTPPPKPRVKPPPRPRPKPVHHIVHRTPPPARPVEAPTPTPAPLPVAPPAPDTVPAPPQPAPVVRHPEKPTPPRVDPSIEARFHDQVRAAVQAAVRYPYAAQVAHLTGRAKVSFEYLDGRVSAVKIITSSGYDVLDHAALQAVAAATYPPPPNNLAGTAIPFEVWVRFYQSSPL